MFEDKTLLRKLKRGDENAMHHVYEKFKHDMLSLAIALARDRTIGEDIVHDVFISFVRISPKLRLRTSLRSYLLSSVANRVRNLKRTKPMESLPYDNNENNGINTLQPDCAALAREKEQLIKAALAQLPYDQREIITLHLQGEMKFREIAISQGLSINTIQSRYRYGIEKLRALLDGKVMS